MKPKIHIVCTASLSEMLLQKLSVNNFETTVHPFIRTTPRITPAAQQRIKELSSDSPVVVFTSANAVHAVGSILQSKPGWKIYCIRGATKDAIAQYFDPESILAIAENAELLAAKIVAANEASLVFFCGNYRMDTVPRLLLNNNIAVEELEVYQTELTPVKLNSNADAILFFSSSAVRSYLSLNHPPATTICFAIGETTASTIREALPNQLVVSDIPGKKEIVELVIQYYHENNGSTRHA